MESTGGPESVRVRVQYGHRREIRIFFPRSRGGCSGRLVGRFRLRFTSKRPPRYPTAVVTTHETDVALYKVNCPHRDFVRIYWRVDRITGIIIYPRTAATTVITIIIIVSLFIISRKTEGTYISGRKLIRNNTSGIVLSRPLNL